MLSTAGNNRLMVSLSGNLNNQDSVVQSIVSSTRSVYYEFLTNYTDFFVEKIREALHIFFNKNICIFEILTFEILTKR